MSDLSVPEMAKDNAELIKRPKKALDELDVMRKMDDLLQAIDDRVARQRVLSWLFSRHMPFPPDRGGFNA